MNKFYILAFWIAYSSTAATSFAEPKASIVEGYRIQAKQASKGFTDFSAERGRRFYEQKHRSKLSEISCASCHGIDPRKLGRTRANKEIEPMAPSVNPTRFTDSAKVEKWFLRNCDDVLSRECTAIEKGDFLTYISSVK